MLFLAEYMSSGYLWLHLSDHPFLFSVSPYGISVSSFVYWTLKSVLRIIYNILTIGFVSVCCGCEYDVTVCARTGLTGAAIQVQS